MRTITRLEVIWAGRLKSRQTDFISCALSVKGIFEAVADEESKPKRDKVELNRIDNRNREAIVYTISICNRKYVPLFEVKVDKTATLFFPT